MTIEEIMSGESEYLELKQMVAEKSETYRKTGGAGANGSGGRIVFGVENGTRKVVGVNQENAFPLWTGLFRRFATVVHR